MAVNKEKKRIEVHVHPEIKDALVTLAKSDNRSLLNYIEVVLERHVKDKKSSKK